MLGQSIDTRLNRYKMPRCLILNVTYVIRELKHKTEDR